LASNNGYVILGGEGTFEDVKKDYYDTVAAREFVESGAKSLWIDTHIADLFYLRRKGGNTTIALMKAVYKSTSLKSVGVLQVNLRRIT